MTQTLLLVGAGLLAGAINAVAGGGSLVSFPALLVYGLPGVTANATNTVAVWFGTVASVWTYRSHVHEERRLAAILAVPSVIGGLAGSVVLLATTERIFRAIVPGLIIFACCLLALHTPIRKWIERRGAPVHHGIPKSLWLAQLAIAFYGGYFGAGIGILMLAVMGMMLPTSLQHTNALKLLCAVLINGVAVAYFLLRGAVALPLAGMMAVASIVGGYLGAKVAQRLPTRPLRAAIVIYGLSIATYLWYRG